MMIWFTFEKDKHPNKVVRFDKQFENPALAIQYAKDNGMDRVVDDEPHYIYSKKEDAKMSSVKVKAELLRPTSGCLLHIKAGDDNYWQPSPEEMDGIASMFKRAINYVDHGGTAVVVTRNHVEPSIVKMFNVENTDTLRRLSDSELKNAKGKWESWSPDHVPMTDEELKEEAKKWDAQKENKHPNLDGWVEYEGLRQEKTIPWGVLFKTDIDKLVRLCVATRGVAGPNETVCREIILDMMHQRGVPVQESTPPEAKKPAPKRSHKKKSVKNLERFNPVYDRLDSIQAKTDAATIKVNKAIKDFHKKKSVISK